jgi:hypothetical protein
MKDLRRPRTLARWCGLVLGTALAAPALAQAQPAASSEAPAQDTALSWSAFGTVGYAQSDRPWRYQRHIDEHGTFQRDTVLGLQLDAQLSPEWSGTLQPRLAPAARRDTGWDLRNAWAFAAWRPGNDWLLRAGKLRLPVLLRSEQLDVGQTYDELRLPSELYSLLPANDFTGAHLTRSWNLEDGELNLDLYRGASHLNIRYWLREGVPGALPAGALVPDMHITMHGLVFTWRGAAITARSGLHHARVRNADGSPLVLRPSWAELGPGLGYWQTRNDLPGPGVPTAGSAGNLILTASVEAALGSGWRLAAEGAHGHMRTLESGLSFSGGYVTAYRSWSGLTGYATLASIRPDRRARAWARTLEGTVLPAVVPGAAVLNATMRTFADTIPLYDQRSLALGAAYALTPRSKLKAEWLHARVRGAQFIDRPAGEALTQPHRVNVFSASYSFVF